MVSRPGYTVLRILLASVVDPFGIAIVVELKETWLSYGEVEIA